LMEVDVAMSCLGLEIGSCDMSQQTLQIQLSREHLPTEPSRRRGCSATGGVANPRRKRGIAGR
jgi:hypothetical protein